MAEQTTETGCIACSSKATAHVQDGAYRKPVCGTHRRLFAEKGYGVYPPTPPATHEPDAAVRVRETQHQEETDD